MDRQPRLIGLLGGMSWESSALYYDLLNRVAHRRLGGHHNARSLLFTLDFDDLFHMATDGRWEDLGAAVATAGQRLQRAGAEFVMITAVTGHAVADQVQEAIGVPLLHIAAPVGDGIRAAGHRRVGLLGTRFTMEMGFFARRLRDFHGIEVLTPLHDDRVELHRIIVEELTVGIVRPASRQFVERMADELQKRGAEAIILGCTELPLLVGDGEFPLPTFDVTQLHVEAAIDFALA